MNYFLQEQTDLKTWLVKNNSQSFSVWDITFDVFITQLLKCLREIVENIVWWIECGDTIYNLLQAHETLISLMLSVLLLILTLNRRIYSNREKFHLVVWSWFVKPWLWSSFFLDLSAFKYSFQIDFFVQSLHSYGWQSLRRQWYNEDG